MTPIPKTQRGWAFVVAIVLGTAGFAGMELHLRRLRAEIGGGTPVGLLVLARDCAPGEVLEREALQVRPVPEQYVVPRSVRERELPKVLGARVAWRLHGGETLFWTDLESSQPGARTLANLVAPGTRAISVSAAGFDGLLRPGDRVDLFAPAVRAEGARPRPELQNVVVLAVGGSLTATPSSLGPSERVTLAARPEQVETLAELSGGGEVVLALRNPTDLATYLPSVQIVHPSRPGREPPVPKEAIEHVR